MRHASILFLLVTFAVTTGGAVESGLPTGVCSENFCGPRQQRIWNRFQSFAGVDYERAPGVYSGICFHNSPNLDGNRVHYGAIQIDKVDDSLFFDGRFSFFTQSNPYVHLSRDKAGMRFNKLFHPTHELEMKRTFAFASLEDRHVSRRYWFRQNRVSDQLVLVSYFGPLHTILCDLARNP